MTRRPHHLAACCFAAALVAPAAAVWADGPFVTARVEPAAADARPATPTTRPRDAAPAPEELDDLLAVLREINPERADLIAHARKQNPERVRELLGEYGPTLKGLIDVRKRDPDLFRLRVDDLRLVVRSLDTARHVREALVAKDGARALAERRALDELVAQHFDVRQKLKERDLKALQGRLEDFRQDLATRAKNRDELVQKRVKDLLATLAKEVRPAASATTAPAAGAAALSQPRDAAPRKAPPSAEELANLLGILRELNPERAQAIEAMRQKNPERLNDLLHDYYPVLRTLAEAKRKDPELFKLRLQDIQLDARIPDLAKKYQDARAAKSNGAAEDAFKQLAAVVGQQVDLRHKLRERDLHALEERVRSFRQEAEARQAAREDLIKRRLHDLLPPPEGEKEPEW